MVYDVYRDSVASEFIESNRSELADGVNVARCKWCGSLFVKEHNREVYCSSFCRDSAREEQSRDKSIDWYHKHKGELDEISRYGLGSGFLGGHRRVDFDDELECVRREFVRLKLGRR